MQCNSLSSKEEILGLWRLEEVEIDAVKRPVRPTIIEINANNSFAVSRTSGDLIGVYRLKDNTLRMRSPDEKWFNTRWSLRYFKTFNFLDLQGIEEGFTGTKLRLKKIEKVPDFEEFEEQVVGKWQLYKIRQKEKIQKLSDTWFQIDTDGNYDIVSTEGIQEEGKAYINTRHQKIVFENDSIQWNAWFYGEELRLNNTRLGIQYSLRRAD